MRCFSKKQQRDGATLIEVLVAIFVMAIGLLALLTLFPIGVLTMAQAIQDERAAQSAVNATALAQLFDLRQDSNITAAFLKPPVGSFVNANNDEPSHPVYVDPIGYRSSLPPFSDSVGGQFAPAWMPLPNPPPYLVPRRAVNYATNNQTVKRWFTLQDDIVFNQVGTPSLINTSPLTFERDTRYSWAYLLRRPRQGDVGVVDMKVVVYNQRPLTLNNMLQGNEPVYQADFMPLDSTGMRKPASIILKWPTTGVVTPPVSVGSWILDATPVPNNGTAPISYRPGHATFYRVVGVTELGIIGGVNQMEIEVQTPVRDFPLPPVPPLIPATLPPPNQTQEHPARYQGVVVVMQGVVEVFDVGTGWQL